MNFIIIISFIILIISLIIAIYPKQSALRFSNINRYDLDTVPRRTVYIVFFVSVTIVAVSLVILLREVSLINIDIPEVFTGWMA